MGAQWSPVFPPAPSFTEKNLEPQDGKVFVVTGGYSGIVSVAFNPGSADSNLFRHNWWMRALAWPLLYAPRKAAYTELYAGLSPDITLERNGCYVYPFGRIALETEMGADLLVATRAERDGGNGKAKEFWEFCEEVTRDYH